MFVLFTDTNSDITPKVAKECGYQLISMPYVINEKEMRPYVDFEEFDYKEYKKNGFKVNKLGDFPLKLETKPE